MRACVGLTADEWKAIGAMAGWWADYRTGRALAVGAHPLVEVPASEGARIGLTSAIDWLASPKEYVRSLPFAVPTGVDL